VALWTVDSWTVRPGEEDVFIRELRSHLPAASRLFRDLEKPSTFWCPRQWDDRLTMDAWHREVGAGLEELVVTSSTHIMQSL
jgi:hypothetical protein